MAWNLNLDLCRCKAFPYSYDCFTEYILIRFCESFQIFTAFRRPLIYPFHLSFSRCPHYLFFFLFLCWGQGHPLYALVHFRFAFLVWGKRYSFPFPELNSFISFLMPVSLKYFLPLLFKREFVLTAFPVSHCPLFPSHCRETYFW